MRVTQLVVIAAVGLTLCGCVKEFGTSTQKGLDAEKQAKELVAGSPFQKPSNEAIVNAIRAFEAGKGEIQTVDVISSTPQDQMDKYVIRARVNGEERTYGLERDAMKAWVATKAPE